MTDTTDATTDAGSTWQAGELVRRTGYGVAIPLATVVGIERDDDGGTFAHIVGRYSPFDDWRHMRVLVEELAPYEGEGTPPTPQQIGEALVAGQREARALIRQAQADRDRAQREHGLLSNEFDEFRATVVRVAQEKARQHGWCSVVNRALQDMGLEANRRFRVQVEVTATRTVSVEVDAEDGEAAWRQVDGMSQSELADAYERYNGESFGPHVLGDYWDYTSHDSSTDTTDLDA
jgi:hypothetical protein